MAEHLYTYDDPPSLRDIQKITGILKNDGVIAYPTDLNWAMGCDAVSVHGLERLRLIKAHKSKNHPFSLIFSSISMAADYVYISNSAYRILKKAWPGPYTILLTSSRSLPRQLKDKRKIIGIRIPNSPLLQAVIESLGRPIASTSFPPLNGEGSDMNEDDSDHTYKEYRFGYEIMENYGHALDMVVDLGHELPGLESTVVDLTGPGPVILRHGAGDPELFEVGGI
jgi:tRNA threonylcarbamoyl adenosine modification protein (Sua5/YciO/YrdC/YwlC family)